MRIKYKEKQNTVAKKKKCFDNKNCITTKLILMFTLWVFVTVKVQVCIYPFIITVFYNFL